MKTKNQKLVIDIDDVKRYNPGMLCMCCKFDNYVNDPLCRKCTDSKLKYNRPNFKPKLKYMYSHYIEMSTNEFVDEHLKEIEELRKQIKERDEIIKDLSKMSEWQRMIMKRDSKGQIINNATKKVK